MRRAEAAPVVPVVSAEHLRCLRELFEEYWRSFGFTPSFQSFGAEVAGLPAAYAPPDSRLALALLGGEAAGCVALRRFDERRCEGKRLYVKPEFRGRGIGRALLDWVIAEARAAGCREMLGDTMPAMERALEMYERTGFERIEPYAEEPTPGAICLRLAL